MGAHLLSSLRKGKHLEEEEVKWGVGGKPIPLSGCLLCLSRKIQDTVWLLRAAAMAFKPF